MLGKNRPAAVSRPPKASTPLEAVWKKRDPAPALPTQSCELCHVERSRGAGKANSGGVETSPLETKVAVLGCEG